MVPSEDEEILGVHDLVREEEADRLKRLLASVHVIAAWMESKGHGRESEPAGRDGQEQAVGECLLSPSPSHPSSHSSLLTHPRKR